MTYSTLGIDGELLEQFDHRTGKKKFVFTPTQDAIGKEVPVQLPQASRRQGLYIIGATGTGKSGLITNLVLQDIKQGKGVAVLDPHTDLTNSILAQLPATHVVNGVKRNTEEDVILLDALDSTHVFGLNLYQCEDPTNDELVQETYERVAHIFEVLWLDEDKDTAFGPQITEGLLYSTYSLIYNSGTQFAGCGMLEIPLLFREDTTRANMVAHIQDSTIRSYWEDEFNTFDRTEKARRAGMIINKINEFITNPIFRRIVGQSGTTIDFSEAMDTGKIVLVKLPGKFEKMTEILGAMIIAQILAASYAREKQQKRRQFNIYADEFQRFATPDFAKLLTEASRKYNTPVTIAHQARDFLDLKNQAASMQVANLIVLRVLYKDAQEVAGSFKISPEAAWEEELEEEWEEEIEPEWFERVEEQVTDGEEDIDTPVKDVVGHLLRGGEHPSPVVNEFANGWLRDMENGAQGQLPALNLMLYNAMTKRPLPSDYYRLFFWYVFRSGARSSVGSGDRSFSYIFKCLDGGEWKGHVGYDTAPATHAFIQYFLTDDPAYLDTFYEHVKDLIRTEAIGIVVNILNGLHSNTEDSRYRPPPTVPDSELQYLQEKVNGLAQSYSFFYHQSHSYFHIDVYQLEWELGQTTDLRADRHGDIYRVNVDVWFPKKGQEAQCIDYGAVDRLVEEIFEQEVSIFEERVAELKDVMQALADEPLSASSGIKQPRTRTQINYHTHPRKTISHPRVAITHPQRPYQDVLNEVASQLANLPNYIARVRITTDEEELVEHTIKTLKPEQGLDERGLEKRIARIKQNMRDLGYYRAKTEVDEEIRKRHERLRQAQGLPVPKPQRQPQQQQQPHYARQVPVQGQCPHCNATNPRSAQFCNQCGAKLR